VAERSCATLRDELPGRLDGAVTFA
jgi:hypothetical protein